MNKLRCIAIDDEPFALELVADNIKKIPFLELVGTFTNPLDAWDSIRKGKADLLFLDIQMPTLTGTQFLRSLPQPPMVIFTTAYEHYALEGFELNAVDYLLKPFLFERFLIAADRAYELYMLRQEPTEEAALEETPAELSTGIPTGFPTGRGFIIIWVEYQQVKLFFDEILYVEALKDYVKIYLLNQNKPLLTRMNLKTIESKLPPNLFCRVHQSYVVSLSKITSFQKTKIHLGSVEIPLGTSYSEGFMKVYPR